MIHKKHLVYQHNTNSQTGARFKRVTFLAHMVQASACANNGKRNYLALKNNKTKSFTLIETMIAMVLMSLVLMIAMLAFDILHREVVKYQKNSAKVNNIYFLYTTIDQDFNNAYVLKNGENFTLQKNSRKITYSFQKSLITREENGETDTLINNINQIKLLQDTITRNKVEESLIFYLPKDTLLYNFSYYTDKIDSID